MVGTFEAVNLKYIYVYCLAGEFIGTYTPNRRQRQALDLCNYALRNKMVSTTGGTMFCPLFSVRGMWEIDISQGEQKSRGVKEGNKKNLEKERKG